MTLTIERKKRLTNNRRSNNIETNLVSNRVAVHIADVVADKEAHRRRREQQEAHHRYRDRSQGPIAEAGTGGKVSPSEAPQGHIQ